jgi:hypothetical protein
VHAEDQAPMMHMIIARSGVTLIWLLQIIAQLPDLKSQQSLILISITEAY